MSRMSKVSSHNTTIANDGIHNILTYHATQVCKWNEKEIILNSGGWLTDTTKTRLNQCSSQFNLGFCVYQKNFSWFVTFQDKTMNFSDGLKLAR